MQSVFKKMNQLGRDQVPFLFILDFSLNNPLVFPLSEVNANDISFDFGKWMNVPNQKEKPADLMFDFEPLPIVHFQTAFDQIQAEIHAGNTYLTNLCFRIPISVNWSLKTLFAQAQSNTSHLLLGRDRVSLA